MSWMSRLFSSFRQPELARSLEEEIESHIALRAEEYMREGMDAEEARRRARLRFGNRTLVQDACREADTFALLEDFRQDLRYGLRMLRKTPGFTLVALAVLALGIGANTAIFSVVRAVLLRPLPFAEPGRLAQILSHSTKTGADFPWVDGRDVLDWRNESRSFAAIGAYHFALFNLADADLPESLYGLKVSANLFPLLGVQPAIGRNILAAEDQPGAGRVVLISDALWRRRFASDPALVGRTIRLSGQDYQVIGIMPSGFNFPIRLINAAVLPSSQMDFWVPLAVDLPRLARGWDLGYRAVARLKPGVPLGQAQADLAAVAARIEREHPDTNAGTGVRLVTLEQETVAAVRPALLVVLAAVGLLVLAACANLANMLLARSVTRRREIAVRKALGAGGGRLVRQALTESLLLGAGGGIAGLALAWSTLGVLLRFSPHAIPRLGETHIDGAVLAFAVGLSLLTGILFGLAPAVNASRASLGEVLKEAGSRSATRAGAARTRAALIVSEVALALVLTLAAGLLIKSFARVLQLDPGFRRDHVLAAVVIVPAPTEVKNRFFQQLVERLEALPGVESAAATNNLGFAGSSTGSLARREDQSPSARADALPIFEWNEVSPQYFRTLGIRLQRGRYLQRQDETGQRLVTVIGESAARRLWPQYPRGEDPVGRRICLDTFKVCPEVVGIVGDTLMTGLDQPLIPQVYVALGAGPTSGQFLLVRTSVPPATFATPLRRTVAAVRPGQGVFLTAPLDEMLSDSVAERRFSMLLLSAFGALALVLAAVGIYGAISYSVAQRTHEIGIRMALGATAGDLRRLVLGEGLALAAVGVAMGLAGAFGLTRLMASLLFGVSERDAVVFAAVPAFLLAVALLACAVPAQRAVNVEPVVALRED